MGIIFAASSTPGSYLPDLGSWDTWAKKGGHMLGYALLAASCLHGLNSSSRVKLSEHGAAMCILILYAVSDEWHQSFTPARSPSAVDVCIDTLGGLIGMATFTLYRNRKTDDN